MPTWDLEAELVRILDGDTFQVRIPLPLGVAITHNCRLVARVGDKLVGVDAPEKHTRAGQRVADLLGLRLGNAYDARTVWLADDKYAGRYLGTLRVDDIADLGAWLLENGLAKRYTGGVRDWTESELARVDTRAVELMRLSGSPRSANQGIVDHAIWPDPDVDPEVLRRAIGC